MPEVLPSIDDQNSHKELNGGNADPVDELGKGKLPRGEGGCGDELVTRDNLLSQPGVPATSENASKHGARLRQVLSEGGRVETNCTENVRNCPLGEPDPLCPHSHIVVFLSEGRIGIVPRHGDSGNGLDEVLEDDVTENFVARDMVPLRELDRSMQAVLRKEVPNIDEVEDHGDAPVGNDGQGQRQVLVRNAGNDGRERIESVIGQRGQPAGYGRVLHGVRAWTRRSGGEGERADGRGRRKLRSAAPAVSRGLSVQRCGKRGMPAEAVGAARASQQDIERTVATGRGARRTGGGSRERSSNCCRTLSPVLQTTQRGRRRAGGACGEYGDCATLRPRPTGNVLAASVPAEGKTEPHHPAKSSPPVNHRELDRHKELAASSSTLSSASHQPPK